MSNGAPINPDPDGHIRRPRPADDLPVATRPAPDEAEVFDRLARLEDQVHIFGNRLSDTGEDLSDTLEQLVHEIVSLRERVTTDVPANRDESSRTTGGRPIAGPAPAPPEMPGLATLYGTLIQFTAGSWWEHVIRPTLRRAVDRSMTASSTRDVRTPVDEFAVGSAR